jgi:cytosine/adenosine deaminase-related metal-dependent hydrolase
MDASPFAIRARYVFPGRTPPIPDGVLTIQGERIVAVGANTSGRPVRDLGNVAILPGLVNAHTHLEFSDRTQPIGQPGMRFPDWIAQVVAQRRALSATGADLVSYRAAAVSRGIQECLAQGTTALGEIATSPLAVWPSSAAAVARLNSSTCDASPLRVTAFLELLGLADSRVESLLHAAREYLAVATPTVDCCPGLSPHAPYTVHPALLAQVCRLSAEYRVPVAMHLAESREELELLNSASGSFRDLLESLEAWEPTAIPRGTRPLDYLQLLATANRALVIHGNYLSGAEIDFLARHRERLSVVYCPRTHAYFGHERYPLGVLLAADINVALGTDSRASNPDLSLLAELRHVYVDYPEVPAATILRMGTCHGARALGLERETGSLIVGMLADLTIVGLPDHAASDPHALLLASDSPVVATFRRGVGSTARDAFVGGRTQQ